MIRVLVAGLMAVLSWIVLLPAFALAGMLWVFVWCVHALGRWWEPKFVSWTDLMTFDQGLGWRPRSDLDANYLAQNDDVFRVVTDREGWAGRGSMDDSAVVVIGDSFAFGYGVDTGSSFADLNPQLVVKGIGAPGYSMVQSVLLMEDLAARLTGKLVVWFVCLENDLEDNLSPAMGGYSAPFARLSRLGGEWEIAQAHVKASPWRCSNPGAKRMLPNFCVPGPIADRAYAGADYLIGRAKAACRRAGAHLVLVTIPDPIQLTAHGLLKLAALSGNPDACDENLPDRRIAASCQRHGVPFIAGKEYLSARDYKRIEGLHWNARGHRRMADVLRRVYESFTSGELDGLAAKSYPMAGERLTLHESPIGSR